MRACSRRKPSASSTDSQHEGRGGMYSSLNTVIEAYQITISHPTTLVLHSRQRGIIDTRQPLPEAEVNDARKSDSRSQSRILGILTIPKQVSCHVVKS
jgi:hypothetical protein